MDAAVGRVVRRNSPTWPAAPAAVADTGLAPGWPGALDEDLALEVSGKSAFYWAAHDRPHRGPAARFGDAGCIDLARVESRRHPTQFQLNASAPRRSRTCRDERYPAAGQAQGIAVTPRLVRPMTAWSCDRRTRTRW